MYGAVGLRPAHPSRPHNRLDLVWEIVWIDLSNLKAWRDNRPAGNLQDTATGPASHYQIGLGPSRLGVTGTNDVWMNAADPAAGKQASRCSYTCKDMMVVQHQ